MVKVDLLDNRISTIGNNGQNRAYKEDVKNVELESLKEIFPFTTQKDLYSFDDKLANKTCSKEVVNNPFYFMLVLTYIHNRNNNLLLYIIYFYIIYIIL